MKSVDMVTEFHITKDKSGSNQVYVKPIRFRVARDISEEYMTIRIDKIICIDEEGFKDDRRLVYTCESILEGIMRRYILKFYLQSTKWMLYKIL